MSDQKFYSAFPVPHEITWVNNKDGSHTPMAGMSLREYVAIEMLKVLIANDETDYDEDIDCAFMIADKFLKAKDE